MRRSLQDENNIFMYTCSTNYLLSASDFNSGSTQTFVCQEYFYCGVFNNI